jgi:hypothetical protein
MSNIRRIKVVAGIAFFVALSVLTAAPALAHQGKELGDYQVEVGFSVEPAVQNQMNGVELFVETKDGQKVEGVEKTIQFEVRAGGKTRTVQVHPVWQDPGHYVGEFMPTLAGDYVFQMKGKINDLPVDETFESGPGRFSSVAAVQDLQFPNLLPAPDQLSAQVASAQAFGLIGMVLGGVGVVVGGLALLRRKV